MVEPTSRKRPRTVRVISTGNSTRLAAAFLGPIGLILAISLVVQRNEIEWWAAIVLWPYALGLLWVIARAPLLGVWLSDERLIARTYFRRIVIPRADLHRCDTQPYSGFLSEHRENRRARELVIVETDGDEFEISGSLAGSQKSILQRDQIRAYMSGVPIEDTLAHARRSSQLRPRRAARHAAPADDEHAVPLAGSRMSRARETFRSIMAKIYG